MWHSIPLGSTGPAVLCMAFAAAWGLLLGAWLGRQRGRDDAEAAAREDARGCFERGYWAGLAVGRRDAATPPSGWRVGRGTNTVRGD